jgi:TonB family protein
MKSFLVLLIVWIVFCTQAKPPKTPPIPPEPPVPPAYLNYLNKLKDTVYYKHYLDSLMLTKNFCQRTDTIGIYPGMIVDTSAAFPGGTSALFKFLQYNIKYPSFARENGKGGKVIIQFIIDENGMVCNPKVLRYAGFGMDEEAIRVIRGMPNWKPAIKNNLPVKTLYVLPVSFKLQ